jgi:hypothetical protein
MNNQRKKRPNNSINASQNDDQLRFSVNESDSEPKHRRTSYDLVGTERASVMAEHSSQGLFSQLALGPVQSFVPPPSPTQLLLHLVLRCMASQLPADHTLRTFSRSEHLDRNTGDRNQLTDLVASMLRIESLQNGSAPVDSNFPSASRSSGSFQTNTVSNQTLCNNEDSSLIQTVINALQNLFPLHQNNPNPTYLQNQQNHRASPWTSQEKLGRVSFSEGSSLSNHESSMSLLTQGTSRLVQDRHHDSSSNQDPVRSERSPSAPSITGELSGLSHLIATMTQGARPSPGHNVARNEFDPNHGLHQTLGQGSSNRSFQPSQLGVLELLQQLSTPGVGTNGYSANPSQNLLRNSNHGVSTYTSSSSTSMRQNSDAERVLTELLRQASEQSWSLIRDGHRNPQSEQNAAQQNMHMPPAQGNETESKKHEDIAELPVTGRRSVILAMSCDKDMLSPYQCLVRLQIELFEASQEDVNTNAQGRNRPIVLGQVGIRCRHCSHLALHLRSRGSTYYPSTSTGLYQAAQNLASGHLCDHCRSIPSSIKDELCQLRERKSSAGGGKKYWADSARVLGVFEDADGLRFTKDSGR